MVVLELWISVRWPSSVPEVTNAVREHVRGRVSELTGLTVTEVAISVTDLVTRPPGRPGSADSRKDSHMRHANRVMAALLSLALIVAGVLLIIEVIADRVNHRPAIVDWHPAYAWAKRTTWNAGSIRVACAVLILLGLVLLIAELKPARVSRLAADPAQAGALVSTPPTPAAASPPPFARPSPA